MYHNIDILTESIPLITWSDHPHAMT